MLKKIIKIIILLLIIFGTNNNIIIAKEVDGSGGSSDTILYTSECGPNGLLCMSWIDLKHLRLTFVDSNGKQKNGTKIIELIPTGIKSTSSPLTVHKYTGSEKKLYESRASGAKAMTKDDMIILTSYVNSIYDSDTYDVYYNGFEEHLKNANQSLNPIIGIVTAPDGSKTTETRYYNFLDVMYYMASYEQRYGQSIYNKNISGNKPIFRGDEYNSYPGTNPYIELADLEAFILEKRQDSNDNNLADGYEDLYLMVEPMFYIKPFGMYETLIGTSYEFAKYTTNTNNYVSGYEIQQKYMEQSDQARAVACNTYIKEIPLKLLSKDWIKNSTSDKTYCSNTQQKDKETSARKVLNGYWANTGSLLDVATQRFSKYGKAIYSLEDKAHVTLSMDYEVKGCDETNGLITIKASFPNVKNKTKEETERMFITTSSFNNNGAYCFDEEITYDFRNTLDSLKNKTKNFTFFTVKNAKLRIIRTCYYSNRSRNAMEQVYNNKEHIATELKANLLGDNYTFEVQINNGEWIKDTTKSMNGSIETRTIEMPVVLKSTKNNILYDDFYIDINRNEVIENASQSTAYIYQKLEDEVAIFIPYDKEGTYETTIQFNNNLVNTNTIKNDLGGLNYSILDAMGNLNTTTSSSMNATYIYNLKYPEEPLSCGSETSLDAKVESNPVYDSVKFRIISLSNPFPAQDGKSRLPGLNWLNEYNFVKDYITNNRQITLAEDIDYINADYNNNNNLLSPEVMYFVKEPIYTITLDASTMINIRDYNRTHPYNDITMNCEEGTGRQCISQFLRNETFIDSDNFTGSCAEISKSQKVDETLQKAVDALMCTSTKHENGICNKNEIIKNFIDYDNNGITNMSDIKQYLVYNNVKNPNFYKCADKNAFSGG